MWQSRWNTHLYVVNIGHLYTRPLTFSKKTAPDFLEKIAPPTVPMRAGVFFSDPPSVTGCGLEVGTGPRLNGSQLCASLPWWSPTGCAGNSSWACQGRAPALLNLEPKKIRPFPACRGWWEEARLWGWADGFLTHKLQPESEGLTESPRQESSPQRL